MTPRLLALTITAAFALGAAGTASAIPILDPFLGNVVGAPTSGTWDTTHSYAVNGKAHLHPHPWGHVRRREATGPGEAPR
jgi:hypothetical protein